MPPIPYGTYSFAEPSHMWFPLVLNRRITSWVCCPWNMSPHLEQVTWLRFPTIKLLFWAIYTTLTICCSPFHGISLKATPEWVNSPTISYLPLPPPLHADNSSFILFFRPIPVLLSSKWRYVCSFFFKRNMEKPCNPKCAGHKWIPEAVLAFDEIDTPNLKPLWALDGCQMPGCITETLQASALSKHFIILLHT